jgi:hypothetical protein
MKVSEVLNYVPSKELEKLSIEYRVDNQVKKLHGFKTFKTAIEKFFENFDQYNKSAIKF